MAEPEIEDEFEPLAGPVRLAVVGLGRIYDLNKLAYVDNDDAQVVALVDCNEERLLERQDDWPQARLFLSVEELVASGVLVDAVEVLVPIVLHEQIVLQCLANKWHVNVQKPMTNEVPS